MRKSFFSKAIVAVGVMASAIALSSVLAMAETLVTKSWKAAIDGADYPGWLTMPDGSYSSTAETNGNATNVTISTDNFGTIRNVPGVTIGSSKLITIQKLKGDVSVTFFMSRKDTNGGKFADFRSNIVNATISDEEYAPTQQTGFVPAGRVADKGTAVLEARTVNITATNSSSPITVPFKTNDSNNIIFRIDVTYDEDLNAAPTEFYNLSGTVKVNDVAKSGVTVSLSGSEYATNTTSVTNDAGEYLFEHIGKNETVKVTVDKTDEYFGNEISGIDITEDTIKDIDLMEIVRAADITDAGTYNLLDGLTATSDNTYVPNEFIYAGHFTEVNGGETSKATKIRYTNDLGVYAIETYKTGISSIKFTTTKKFKVTVPFNSNGDVNTSDLAIRVSNGARVSEVFNCTGTTPINLTAILDPGTYEIYSPGATTSGDYQTNGRGARLTTVTFAEVPEFVGTAPTTNTNNSLGIIKGDGEYYVYALVSGDKLADYDVITISKGTNSIDVDEVYKEITFNGGSLTVQDSNNYMAVAYLDGVSEQPDLTGYTATFVAKSE